jgi:hypothetical protein
VPTGVEGEKVGTKEGRRRQDPAVAASKPEPVPSARRDKPSTRAARVGYQRWWWWEKANCTGISHTGQGARSCTPVAVPHPLDVLARQAVENLDLILTGSRCRA